MNDFYAEDKLSEHLKSLRKKNEINPDFLIDMHLHYINGEANTVEGFILCYTLALPFFVNTVIGDLFFTYVLKHSFKLIESKLKLNYVS